MKLLIIFRHYREDLYSDRSRDPNKKRPAWFTNSLCLKSILISASKLLDRRNVSLVIWYDVSQQDLRTDPILPLISQTKYAEFTRLVQVDYSQIGSNSAERLSAPDIFAYIRSEASYEYIYMVENDYLHNQKSIEAVVDIFKEKTFVDYLNLSDHRDYYHLPIHQNYQSKWAYTTEYLIRTNATTTGTYATRREIMLEDMQTMLLESDFNFFNLLTGVRGRRLWTVVPGLAAHCMAELLPPGVNWDQLAQNIWDHQ